MFWNIVEYIVVAINIVGIIVILIGFVKAIVKFIATEWKICLKGHKVPHLSGVRHDLGIYLLLGLEFIIAADIITTILNPNLDHLLVLGGMVVIRIAISYFLGKEIDDMEKKQK